jgi:Co/Zn/Cd efflux system component
MTANFENESQQKSRKKIFFPIFLIVLFTSATVIIGIAALSMAVIQQNILNQLKSI